MEYILVFGIQHDYKHNNIKNGLIKMALHLKSTGIDFADFGDAGGMTSELFDDYEEGTW